MCSGIPNRAIQFDRRACEINLHKSSHATTLAAGLLEGTSRAGVYHRSKEPRDSPPRAAIFASRDIGVNSLDSWCSRDCAVGVARIHGRPVLLVSIYMDIKLPVEQQWLTDLMSMIQSKGYPVIMGIDSNAHSTLYGPDNNARGDDMEDFILRHAFQVENIGQVPTFEVRRANTNVATHIDVTLSRPAL